MRKKSLLTPQELAIRWDVSTHTLSQWRWNGRGPLFVKLGRRIMYRLQDVEYFEEQKLRRDTTQADDGVIQISTSQGKDAESVIDEFLDYLTIKKRAKK